jgi:large subunit ribosomal protein L17
MRHQRVINHLGRTRSHRKSMISNMAVSLILHKRITTTTAKAKALKTFVEPLITKSKEDSTHSRRVVFGYLKDKSAVAELFRDISPKIADRPGGYTRLLKTGNRIGDNAEMCILELVDFNEAMKGGEAAKPKAVRRRRSTKKSTEGAAPAKAEKPAATKAKKAAKKEEAPKGQAPEIEGKE